MVGMRGVSECLDELVGGGGVRKRGCEEGRGLWGGGGGMRMD